MKIVVLNGSPKGKESITTQYVRFIRKHFPVHEYVFHSISARIKKIEKSEALFQEIVSDVDTADVVLWSTPVYTFFVPAQYMRFIELIHERERTAVFKRKPTAVITTSIHFYDHTAHRYMQAVCDDLDMNYLGFFSPEMDDILSAKGRNELLVFAGTMFDVIAAGYSSQAVYSPVPRRSFLFEPVQAEKKINRTGKNIVVVTDCADDDHNLKGMIQTFVDTFEDEVDVQNLRALAIDGGCTGCIQCGYDNTCMYKDNFRQFYTSTVMTADILFYAAALKHRNLSSTFKMFFDRRFFMNHVPELKNKQIGVLASGNIHAMPYMYDFFQGAFEWQAANLTGIVTDTSGDSAEISRAIQQLAEKTVLYANTGYRTPSTFLGVGAGKIFRDDIWGKLRFVFQADHAYYKRHGLYNFPHKKYKTRLFNLIMMTLNRIPAFRKEFYKRVRREMCKPHQKIVEKF